MNPTNIAIIGAGTIGKALAIEVNRHYPNAAIHLFSRQQNKENLTGIYSYTLDYSSEKELENAANEAAQKQPLDLVIVTVGMLHNEHIMPEKSLTQLSTDKFLKLFTVNTVLPALIGKHFIPKLNKQNRSVFAALSARVGSISDNRLGGWYAYRASKAALNMTIKNMAIETKLRNPKAIVVTLHPGTVDSGLSKPFQARLKEGQLFNPAYAAQKMLAVVNSIEVSDSGKCFAWDGKEITP